MLVLTLCEGDYIQIGDDMRVYIDSKAGEDALAIAIDAPPTEKILRGKLYEKMIQEQAGDGDRNAVEISQNIAADKYERERMREEKLQISQHVRERRARQKARKEALEATP
jgi:sRNA-binding carbon storage regulator CsrA